MASRAHQRRRARRVGAVTLVVMLGVIAALIALGDRAALGGTVRIEVVMRRTGGLRERAPFVVGGQAIGRIEAIALVPHGAPGPLRGEPGIAIAVAIDADRAWQVPAAGEVFVAARGALAERYLEVAPPPGDPGPAIRDGQVMRGIDPPSLDNVMQRMWTQMTTYRLFVAVVRPELTALRGEIARLRGQLDEIRGDPATEDAAALAANVRALIAAGGVSHRSLGGDGGLGELRATIGDARRLLVDARATIAALDRPVAATLDGVSRIRTRLAASASVERATQVIAAIRATLDRIDPLVAALDDLGQRIAAGEGSVGRIMRDPEFPEDAKDLGKILKRRPWRIMEPPADR